MPQMVESYVKWTAICSFNQRLATLERVLGIAQLRNYEDSEFKDIVDVVCADLQRIESDSNRVLYVKANPGILATLYSLLSALSIFVLERINSNLGEAVVPGLT